MNLYEKNTTYMFVANALHTLSNADALSALPDKAVCLFTEASTGAPSAKVDAISTGTKYRLIGRNGSNFYYSPYFDYADIVKKAKALGVAASEQTTYIGYNGTSGSMGTVLNNTLYTLQLELFHTQGSINNTPLIKTVPWKTTDTTQSGLAAGIANVGASTFAREPQQTIWFERVNSGTSIATSGGTIALVQGSVYVSIDGTGADAGKYDTDGSTIVAGDILRIGHATTKTYPCYKVAEVVSGGGATTMVVKLDVPYQQASNSALAANSVGVIAAASEGDWGLKLTGVTQAVANFAPVTDNYKVVRFKPSFFNSSDYATTSAIVTTTDASEGIGDGRAVAQMEVYTKMVDGNPYIQAYPSKNYRLVADQTLLYNMITLEFQQTPYVSVGTGIAPKTSFTIIIAVSNAASNNDYDTFETIFTV